jgi:aryl-alcohol dehydrogenase
MTNDGIQAAVFRDRVHDATIESVMVTELRDDEVLVKLVATGICHSDLTCRDGFMAMPRPVILGHEGAGRVEKVGSKVTSVKIGDPVVLTFLSCGECPNCTNGIPAYCFRFAEGNFTCRRLDGSTALADDQGEISSHFFGQSSFATHSVSNERNVIKIRADAPLELLGPLGCGVQTGAGAVMNVLQPEAGESIVIFGAGGVGLSAVMAAKVVGCTPIIVVEPNPERRALALELGAHHALDPAAKPNMVEKLHALTGGMLNNAFDTCGIPAVIQMAIEALFLRGKIALVTSTKLDDSLDLPLFSIIGRGVTIRGVNEGDSVPHSFIPKLVDLIVEGRFPLQKLVKFYDFHDINRALEDQEHGTAIKPILRMN